MRKIFSPLTILTLALCSYVSAQPSGSLTNGLVSYYTFEGNADDVVGTNNATGVGVILTNGVTGAPNSAYYFNGASSYLTASFTPTTNNAFTWSLWINPATNQESYPLSAAFFNQPQISPSFYLLSNGSIAFQSYDPTLSGEENAIENILTAPSLIPLNSWTMLTVTSDTNNLRTFFINGVAVTNKVSSSYGEEVDNLLFGIDRLQRDEFSLYGSLDDVAMYDRPLSSSEVSDLYQAQLVPEPSTYALLLLSGAASLCFIKRRKV